MESELSAIIKNEIACLCQDPRGRSVGRESNRAATLHFLEKAREYGFETHSREFHCLDWEAGAVSLESAGQSFTAFPSPYSQGCSLSGILVAASSLVELKDLELRDSILLLHQGIANSPLMPKNFVFYNPEEHKELIELLEEKQPLAIISATAKNPELAGAVYPTPMFEDGDFDIPSVFLSEEEGARLLPHAGRTISLISTAQRLPTRALHIRAVKGDPRLGRIVLSAHLDTKIGTPGALDNAAGTAVLIALMQILQGYRGNYQLEVIPFNGEDYYAASGEMLYLEENGQDLSQVKLCLNFDAVGHRNQRVLWCGFNLESRHRELLESVFQDEKMYIEGEQWWQGDQAIFAMQGIPTLAFCSENLMHLLSEIAHTAKDVPELADPELLAGFCHLVKDLIEEY